MARYQQVKTVEELFKLMGKDPTLQCRTRPGNPRLAGTNGDWTESVYADTAGNHTKIESEIRNDFTLYEYRYQVPK